MGAVELMLVAIGLSMDAFAVSICKGLGMKRINIPYSLTIALFFGGFQALMPCIGWFLGTQFQMYIVRIDHWIAFIMLCFIGVKMVKDSLNDEGREIYVGVKPDYRELLLLAVATSIDALAVGLTIAFLNGSIVLSSAIIGIVTFVITLFGVWVGVRFGSRFEQKAGVFGGVLLIGIGLKILFEHLGIITF